MIIFKVSNISFKNLQGIQYIIVVALILFCWPASTNRGYADISLAKLVLRIFCHIFDIFYLKVYAGSMYTIWEIVITLKPPHHDIKKNTTTTKLTNEELAVAAVSAK